MLFKNRECYRIILMELKMGKKKGVENLKWTNYDDTTYWTAREGGI